MGAPRKYRKKASVVEAVQWTGPEHGAIDRLTEWGATVHPIGSFEPPNWPLALETLNGPVGIEAGWWILKGETPGDYYPCSDAIFATGFEEV